MKKIVLTFLAGAVAFVAFALYVDRVRPVDDVTGCYSSDSEKICLTDNGEYEQIFQDGSSKSKGTWRKFKYELPEGEYVAIVLNGYRAYCQGCERDELVNELDLQPKYTPLRGVHFYRAAMSPGENEKVLYRRAN